MTSIDSNTSPYLSVVAASRNDDHGGDPLVRTQIFINCFARQCERFKLPAEIILVDWNPVAGRPGLAEVLSFPEGNPYCTARVVTVTGEMHQTLKYSEDLPLFQMIAKNVGIRRARGEFVLATNIDIVFSNELIEFIARRKLDPRRLYRVDRYDIKVDLPADVDLDTALDRAWTSVIRTNIRSSLDELTDHLYGKEPSRRDCGPNAMIWDQVKGKVIDSADGKTWEDRKGIRVAQTDGVWYVEAKPGCPFEHLNTNACGDFTMLSKEAWAAIRGYPDFEAYSFNIDSMGLIMGHYHGFQETSLLPPCVSFHIEHALGSGWTPEGAQKLFNRLNEKRILNPEWYLFLEWFAQMRKEQKAIPFNRDDWGLAAYFLEEHSMGSSDLLNAHDRRSNVIAGSVGSLRPAFDLDRIALFYERESRQLNAVPETLQAAAEEASTLTPAADTNSDDFVHHKAIFDHNRDSYTLSEHFAKGILTGNPPLVVWCPEQSFELIRSRAVGHGERELIAGAGFFDRESPAPVYGLLLASDPRQLILDLQRHGLLAPRTGNRELAIWVHSDDPIPVQYIRWLPSVKLARRLLSAVGWSVVFENQSELR